MRRLLLACTALLAALAGCARHVVVPREFGRIDGARSISTRSDPEWTLRQEPEPAKEAAP